MATGSGSTSGSPSLATLTILGRLRHTKYLWAFSSLVVLAAFMFAAEATVVRTVAMAGDIGLELQHSPDSVGTVATINSAQWPTLRPGDQTVSINGLPTDGVNFFDVSTAIPPGPVKVRVRRGDQLIDAEALLGPPRLMTLMSIAIRWITGALIYLLGLGAFVLRPGARVSWVFALFTFNLGSLLMITDGFPVEGTLFYSMYTTFFSFAPVLGLHFFTLFPKESPTLTRVVKPMYVFFALLSAVRIGLAVAGGSDSLLTSFDIVGRVMAVAIVLAVLVHLIRNWRLDVKANNERAISMSRTLMIAALLGLTAPLVINTMVRILKWDGGIAHQTSAGMVLIFAVLTTTVLVRHNPLEIDRYSASVVGYVTTLGLFGALFAILLLTIPFGLRRLGLGDRPEAWVVLTAGIVFSIGPTSKRLRKVVDRWFSRERADALQTSAVLRRTSDAVQREGRDAALKIIIEAATLIGPEFVGLWQVDPSGRNFHRLMTNIEQPAGEPLTRTAALASSLEVAGGVSSLSPQAQTPETQDILWQLGLAMVAPARSHGVVVGFLGVGRRKSGFSYTAEDLAYLEMLGSQAGSALERSEVVTQIGRYRIEKRLASGGMAEVFVAWQLGAGGFERKVALKRLLPELAENPASAAGLLDEARITARLQHRNIAQVFEVGLEGGQHFIAMELVDGPPLRSLMASQKRVSVQTPLPVALMISRSLLSALQHAHDLKDQHGAPLNVVHRDVTPANVLVSRNGEPKLIDFGLVLATSRLFRTETGIARGTMPFMSPEQATHTAIDRRADVFSAAATLYELFTGARAFVEGPFGPKPALPSSVRHDLPPAVDDVFHKAYAAKPDDRFESAAAFAEALSRACGVEPATEAVMAAWVQAHSDAPPPVVALEETRSAVVPTGGASDTQTKR